MKNKIIVTIFGLLLFTTLGTMSVFAASKNSADKIQVESLTKSYIDFLVTFHQFPQDKMESDTIDDSTINQIINDKKLRVDEFAKPGSKFYHESSDMISAAMKSQKNKIAHIVIRPNNAPNDKKGNINTPASKPEEAQGIRSFGGYISEMQINSTEINDNLATVKLSYISHATFGQWQKDHWVKSSPANQIIQEINFNKDESGKWYIIGSKWEFAPGSEP